MDLYREPLQEGHFGRPLFVQSCTNKGPPCGGRFMGSTYRGPVYGCPTKSVPLRKPYEEDAFEMMVEGPF